MYVFQQPSSLYPIYKLIGLFGGRPRIHKNYLYIIQYNPSKTTMKNSEALHKMNKNFCGSGAEKKNRQRYTEFCVFFAGRPSKAKLSEFDKVRGQSTSSKVVTVYCTHSSLYFFYRRTPSAKKPA